jgi:hypothetical protein
MKVGDLVQYKEFFRGLSGLIGIIVEWNGELPVVYWLHNGETSIAIRDFIEVLNESR